MAAQIASASLPSFFPTSWKSKYGGMELSEVKRLKVLEKENEALKMMVAEQALDMRMLKDVNSKKW